VITSARVPSEKRLVSTGIDSSVSKDKDAEIRTCYLTCGFCRWDSRKIDLTSDSINNLNSKCLEQERLTDQVQSQYVSRVIELLQLEEREKNNERLQQAKLKRGPSYLRPSRTHIASVSLKNAPLPPPTSLQDLERKLLLKEQLQKAKRSSFPPTNNSNNENKNLEKPMETLPNKSQEPKVALDNNIGNIAEHAIDTKEVATLEQRYLRASSQPVLVRDLRPIRKLMMVYLSKHCRKCDKLLVKLDPLRDSIGDSSSHPRKERNRYHVAISYIPRITIAKVEKLSLLEECSMMLRITNPVHSIMQISIREPMTRFSETNEDQNHSNRFQEAEPPSVQV